MKNIAKTCLTAAALSVLGSNVLALDLEGTVYEKVGREFDVDPVLLYSVALVESAVVSDDGAKVSPYPWTLRSTRPYYAKSRKEAEKELRKVLARGENVDVGLMQINTKWHGHRVESVSDLLDPETNLRVGASILAERLRATPADALLAIGRYHSYTPERSEWYARHVIRIWSCLRGFEQ